MGITDNERSYFLAFLPVHPDMERKSHARGQAKGQVQKIDLSDIEKAVLTILRKGPCSTEELANELGLKSRSGFFTRTLRGLMKDGFIDYVYPESPRHPDQKYRLSTG